MMTLLTEIKERGISLWVDAGSLRYRAPTGTMDAGILSRLRQYKSEIVKHLDTESAKSSKTCENCRACAHWRGVDRCFALALFDGKPGSPTPVLPKACERWQARD